MSDVPNSSNLDTGQNSRRTRLKDSQIEHVPRDALERTAATIGLALDPETSIKVIGPDPILKSPMPIGLGASTVLALIGQEVGRIWESRGARPQHISLDARHVTTSLRSYGHLEIDGELASVRRAVPNMTGFWSCADGREIFLHESFTDVPGILSELGLSPNGASNEEIARAAARRSAFELEDALAAKGLCAVACRSAEEWREHPQGIALAGTSPVEVIRIGDAPPVPFPAADRPLDGIRVLDLTRVLAGPVCGRTLAEHGAEVLHIASPNLPTFEVFEVDTGHGKRQAFLDLDRDRAILEELTKGADVFCQSYRPLAFKRRGLGPEELADMKPGIVYVAVSAFGATGPWSHRPGWEQMGQTATGIAHLHGGKRPRLAPAAICDYTTGYLAALGALVALRRRATEGGSWLVNVSLARSAMWYLELGTNLDPSVSSGEGNRAAWMIERQSDFGLVRHVAPPLRMSDAPPRWTLPPARLGSGKPKWSTVSA